MLAVRTGTVDALSRRGYKAGGRLGFTSKLAASAATAAQFLVATDAAPTTLLVRFTAKLTAALGIWADASAGSVLLHEGRRAGTDAKVRGISRWVEPIGRTLAEADAIGRATDVPTGKHGGTACAVDARFVVRTRDAAGRDRARCRDADANQGQHPTGSAPGERAEHLPARQLLGQMTDKGVELLAIHTCVLLSVAIGN